MAKLAGYSKNCSSVIGAENRTKPNIQAAIAEVSETVGLKGRRYLRFKLHNKLDALDKLCRYLGLFERDNEQKGARMVIIFQNSRGKKVVSNETQEAIETSNS